jgi:hypothetical protein
MTVIMRAESGLWPLAVLVLVLSVAAVVVDYRRRRTLGTAVTPAAWLAASDVLIAGNLAMVAVLTLSPGGAGRVLNLVPFREITDLWTHVTVAGPARVEIIGNFLLFAPAASLLYLRGRGAAAAAARRHRIAFRTVWTIAGMATGIEVAQYLLALGRIASITDVLLPPMGAGLAVGITESVLAAVTRLRGNWAPVPTATADES